jgi:hypothetical protein
MQSIDEIKDYYIVTSSYLAKKVENCDWKYDNQENFVITIDKEDLILKMIDVKDICDKTKIIKILRSPSWFDDLDINKKIIFVNLVKKLTKI